MSSFTAADQQLCLAVLKQSNVGSANYESLKDELGLPSKNAAQVRWSRFNSKLKDASKAGSFTEADQKLCLAVLKQSQIGKVDYDLLKTELNLPSKNAAQVRWSRFNSKLKQGASPTKTNSEAPSTTPPSTPKTPKSKGFFTAKKRKVEEMESEGSDKHETDDQDIVLETPSKRNPSRRARVTNFKEADTESESEAADAGAGTNTDLGAGSETNICNGLIEEDVFHDSEEYHNSGEGTADEQGSDAGDFSDDEI